MSDLLPLAEAAELLGMSSERVRQLVVDGQLPGQRFGNVWVVPKGAVVARRHSPGVRGRPLGPMNAWREILAGSVNLRNAGRFQHRANVMRCEMSRSDIASLPQLVDAKFGGVVAAIDLGEPLVASDHVDVYVSAGLFPLLERHVAYVPHAVGHVAVRVVDDRAWTLLPEGRFVPRSAVALDLLESGDPRHWVAAEQLVAAIE